MLTSIKNRVLNHYGLEVRRSGTFAQFLRTRPIDLIVDAGANLGQFAQSVRKKGYTGRISSFEPVGYVFDALKRFADKDPKWDISKSALGDKEGFADINVLSNHSLSSFLKPTEMAMSYDTEGAMTTERVPVRRLDDILAADPAKAILLKVDVQGFEKQVLEGARNTLSRCVGLYLELPIRHLYEGSWTFREAINFLDDLGFEPAQFRMVSPLPDDPASAVEFDSLFRRKDG